MQLEYWHQHLRPQFLLLRDYYQSHWGFNCLSGLNGAEVEVAAIVALIPENLNARVRQSLLTFLEALILALFAWPTYSAKVCQIRQ